MSLDELVNVVISLESAGITRVGFGIPMIVGDKLTISERSKLYSSSDLSELENDLTNGTSDPEYKMAQALISVSPRPASFMVGRIDSGDASITASLNAIKAYDNSWYTLLITDRTKANQVLAMEWTESQEKVFFTASSEAEIVDTVVGSDTDSLAKQSMAYSRTAILYHSLAGDGDLLPTTKYPDATLAGRISPYTAGSYTAMFKQLTGIPSDNLSPSQSINALAKSANIYEEFGGKDILRSGTVGSGEFIDVVIFIDWLKVRIQEEIFALLVKVLKIPFTDNGITQIANALEKPLSLGQENGGISGYAEDEDGNQIGGYLIEQPRLEDISSIDKSNRNLPNVKFTAWLAGAIHIVNVNGTVIV